MCRSGPPVTDREDLGRSEQAEGHERDRDADQHADEDVDRRLHPERHPAHRHQRQQPGSDPLPEVAPAPLRHQRVQDHDDDGGQHTQPQRGQRPSLPVAAQLDPERTWPPHHADHPEVHLRGQDPGDQKDDQVPEPPQHQQCNHDAPQQGGQEQQTARCRQHADGRSVARQRRSRQPPHDRVVDHGQSDCCPAPPAPEQHDRQQRHRARGHQPPRAAGADVAGQRRRLAGRSRRPDRSRGPTARSAARAREPLSVFRRTGMSIPPPHRGACTGRPSTTT